jgi:hypothetical protein
MLRIASFLPLAACLLAACSTVGGRIADHQTEFDQYPPQVQQQIRAGQVAVGFTPAQVRMALGKPDRVLEQTDASGQATLWIYTHSRPSLSLGLGGFGGGSTAVGGGVGVATPGGSDERARVIFRDGRVSEIQRRKS